MGLYFDIQKFNKERFNELADKHHVIPMDDAEPDEYEDLYNLKNQREILNCFFDSFETPEPNSFEDVLGRSIEREEYDFHELTKERLEKIITIVTGKPGWIGLMDKEMVIEIINDLITKTDFEKEVITFSWAD